MIMSYQRRSEQVSKKLIQSFLIRFIRSCTLVPQQKDWRVFCHEDFEKGRHYQAEAG